MSIFDLGKNKEPRKEPESGGLTVAGNRGGAGRIDEQTVELPKTAVPERYIPRRNREHPVPVVLDGSEDNSMARATQEYRSVINQNTELRKQLETTRAEIGIQRHRIELLEQALAEAKNEAANYRSAADEAKAETSGWKAFFANLQAMINQYDLPLPSGAPIKKPVRDAAPGQLPPEQPTDV